MLTSPDRETLLLLLDALEADTLYTQYLSSTAQEALQCAYRGLILASLTEESLYMLHKIIAAGIEVLISKSVIVDDDGRPVLAEFKDKEIQRP